MELVLHMSSLKVLILVLVEHTLGDDLCAVKALAICLNPCFSGTYSRSAIQLVVKPEECCLNPCFSGTYSRRATFATSTISMHYAPKNGT